MRLRPTRIANADAALPARHRNRRPTNAASAKAREAWPLGKEGSNSASHPYPMRVRTFGNTPLQGRGLPTRNLIPSVRTTVIPRSRRKSNVASRHPRHHSGTANRTLMNAAPSGVLKGASLLEVHALAAAPVAVIRRHVRIAGLHRTKPARLKAFCRHLIEESDGDLATYFNRPTEVVRADLLAQDGVGPETADSILLYAGRHPVFVVDAYTIRIGGRVGLFDTAEYGAVQRFFERRLPRDLARFQEYHALLVAHAKTLCRHADPVCDACPLQSRCDFGRSRKR